MKKSLVLIMVVGVVVMIAGAFAATSTDQEQDVPNITTSSTKVALYNNGSTWLHSDAIIENATLKNGTQQNFYVRTYLKPENGTLTLDLSNMLGYGDQKLPAGTTLKVLAWRGLFNPTAGGTSTLDLKKQGWSSTIDPVSTDLEYNMTMNNLHVNQLPANITDNNLTVSTDITQFHETVPDITNGLQPVYEEYLIMVDENGKVTILETQPPTLCNIMAQII